MEPGLHGGPAVRAAGAPSWTRPAACPPASSGDISPASVGTIWSPLASAPAPRTGRTRRSGRPSAASAAASGARSPRLTVTPPRLNRGRPASRPILAVHRGRTGVRPHSGPRRLRTEALPRAPRPPALGTLPPMTPLPASPSWPSAPCSRSRPPRAVTRCPPPTASSGTSRTPRPGRRTAAASPPAAAPIPFNGFGYLKLQVRRGRQRAAAAQPVSARLRPGARRRRAIRLHHAAAARRRRRGPRDLRPKDTTYLRYFDSFVQQHRRAAHGRGRVGRRRRRLRRRRHAWRSPTTSSGDRADRRRRHVRHGDAERARRRRPDGRARRATGRRRTCSGRDGRRCSPRVGDMYADPFADTIPASIRPTSATSSRSSSRPAQTAALVTFVVKGLSEVYDPRGGFPIARQDALLSTWSDPSTPAPTRRSRPPARRSRGSPTMARQLVAAPDLRGLTPRQRAQIVNWTLPASAAPPPFTVFEKTVIAAAGRDDRRHNTSEDIVREYLTRADALRPQRPDLPRDAGAQPARDRRRARARRRARRGRVRGPFHGVPIVLKDNIDATGLPTTGGALALRRSSPAPRLARRRRHEGRAAPSCSARPISTSFRSATSASARSAARSATPTIRRSAPPARAAAARPPWRPAWRRSRFGTDTCNSLSNPSGFASLATIRTTRGLTSRAGVMPLNTVQRRRRPDGARSVRDVALALDLVAGADPEDPATPRPTAHAGLVRRRPRAGVAEGRAHRRVPAALRRHHRRTRGRPRRWTASSRSCGPPAPRWSTSRSPTTTRSTARPAAARPDRSRPAGTAYLSRGAKPGRQGAHDRGADRVGQDGAGGQRRLEGALAPGAHRRRPSKPRRASSSPAAKRFARCSSTSMDRSSSTRCSIPPTRPARTPTKAAPSATAPSRAPARRAPPPACRRSPCPAGFIGGRYPVGISFLGRLWDDRRLLAHWPRVRAGDAHRRPPATVK